MLAGATAGAALYLHQGATVPLAAVAGLVAVTGVAFSRTAASHRLDDPA
jgi:hypothetical protein